MMKNLINLKALIALCFFALTSQCSSDKLDLKPLTAASSAEVKQTVISSAEQLASDTSFIASVKMTSEVTHILYEKMRLLGSNEARKQQAARIIQLLTTAESQDNSKALAQEFGFENEQELKKTIYVLFKRRIELTQRYSNYDGISPALLRKAYDIEKVIADSRTV